MKNDLIYRKDAYDSLMNGMSMTGYQSRALDCIAEYSIPAVDAVEVVRCNMCLFRPKESTYCYELERHTADGYYCAFGQFREESDEK